MICGVEKIALWVGILYCDLWRGEDCSVGRHFVFGFVAWRRLLCGLAFCIVICGLGKITLLVGVLYCDLWRIKDHRTGRLAVM